MISAALRSFRVAAAAATVADRVEAFDWEGVSGSLDAQGSAMLERLLSPDESRALAGLYGDGTRFRSHVVMARHGFGRGEYKYFSYPLPRMVADLRSAFYPRLAPIGQSVALTMTTIRTSLHQQTSLYLVRLV